MFTTFPKTKTYFGHLDLSHGSEHLRSLGKKIVVAIAEGTMHISTPAFTSSLGYLSSPALSLACSRLSTPVPRVP
ncbi:hypothetical protein QTP70_000316 [Hemibagrus guttatus]|uniref:Globin domain-containing protein n=1 Tax=Hemibagrus guttatus TaxID=175788 RepID=A0AAE0QPQ6_9TELE|nr:hypothetical protein QTP70_000316 [Hemibagrus guttatus]KAK3559013.1 hypothetical protein QTP86_000022 [Hemibagrus guttatus]